MITMNKAAEYDEQPARGVQIVPAANEEEAAVEEDPGDIACRSVPEEGEYAEQTATKGMIVRSNQSAMETYSRGNMVKDAEQVEVGELPIELVRHPGNTRDYDTIAMGS